MIPESTAALYKSIKAPDSLQQRIDAKMAETPAEKKKNRYLPILAAAACLAVVISLTVPRQATISINGNTVGTTPVAIAQPAPMQRAIALAAAEPLVIELELNSKKDAAITVTHGEIEKEDTANGSIIRWIIADPQSYMAAKLALTINNRTTTYTLHADAFGVWYMEKDH